MDLLTDRQKMVLDYIAGLLGDNRAPSQREIARHFGLAQNAVYQLVGYLKKKGYLVDSGGHRGLRLSDEYRGRLERAQGVPIIGRVAAGEPIVAEENIEERVELGDLFGGGQDVFLLRVVGDSMVDEGIMDGDLVVVERRAEVKDGQIGVVLLDDEATVKKVYVQKGRIALKPANRAAGYKTRYIKPSEKAVCIVGKVAGCIRVM